MQYKFTEYVRESHDLFKALTVKNPFAHWISIGVKLFEIRSKPTSYRGNLIICSSQKPEIPDMQSGSTLCKVHLYDCVKVSDMTDDEWSLSMLPMSDKSKYRDHYGWALKDVRKVIELPVSGNLGIWNLVLTKDELIEYPEELIGYLKRFKKEEIRLTLYQRYLPYIVISLCAIATTILLYVLTNI